MPRYDYRCDECGAVIEISHGFDRSSEGNSCWDFQCPGTLRLLISMPWVHYKGYGFHVTDNRDASERYSFDHFDGSGTNAEEKAMGRRIKHPDSTIPKK